MRYAILGLRWRHYLVGITSVALTHFMRSRIGVYSTSLSWLIIGFYMILQVVFTICCSCISQGLSSIVSCFISLLLMSQLPLPLQYSCSDFSPPTSSSSSFSFPLICFSSSSSFSFPLI